MSVEYELKQQLDSIIDFAYRNATQQEEPRLEKYKYFRIKYTDKEFSSFLARYHHKGSYIEMTKSRERGKNINQYVILIHELSHHIQAVKYGRWDTERKLWHYNTSEIKVHGKEFYEIYEKLLHATIDLKILNYDEIRNMPHVAIDHNKVQKMLDRYNSCTDNTDVNTQKQDKTRIYCYNSYNYKDALKQDGYKYNQIVRAWYKELPKNETEKEKQKLLSLGLKAEDIVIKDANTFIDMKAEVEKPQSEKCYIVQFNYNKDFVLWYGGYGELKKLKEKCPYIKIKQYENSYEGLEEAKRLQNEENLTFYDEESLEYYVKEYVRQSRKKKENK